jgi:uncharacterized protein YebE (UPF0316 family)
MVKNLKKATVAFGFLEALVYIFGLAMVLTGEQNILEMGIYALGYAMGLFVGILVEQKLAIGYSTIEVNINHDNDQLVNRLRELGYGVTVYTGDGKYGERKRLDILTQRKSEKELIRVVLSMESEAFIVAFEPKTFRGGYLTEMMKKSRLK